MRSPASADGLQLLEWAARGEFPTTLYVDGPDEGLKAAFLAGLRRAWAAAVPLAPIARIMRPGEDEIDAILASFQNLSMFTPRELTLVLGVESLVHGEKRVTALAEGLSRPAGESCLVLVEAATETLRKSLDPLRAACSAVWRAERTDARTLLAWGRARLAAEGVQAEAGVLESLLERCELESVAFFSELGKLAGARSATERLTRADLELLAQPVLGAELDGYLRAVAAGQAQVAAVRLGRLMAAGEGEGSVLWALGNLVGGALGGWGKWKDLSFQLQRRSRPRELAAALDAVYRAEAAWKSGRVDALVALEQATRDVSG